VEGLEADQLKSLVERIERLEEGKAAIASDIKDVYQEAKSRGFEPKVIRQVVRRRKMEREAVEEEDALTQIYEQALGEE